MRVPNRTVRTLQFKNCASNELATASRTRRLVSDAVLIPDSSRCVCLHNSMAMRTEAQACGERMGAMLCLMGRSLKAHNRGTLNYGDTIYVSLYGVWCACVTAPVYQCCALGLLRAVAQSLSLMVTRAYEGTDSRASRSTSASPAKD